MTAKTIDRPARGKAKPSKHGEDQAGRVPKILLVGSAKGGTGKTTTALNLAAVAASTGLSVALVDCDAQRSLSKVWADRDATSLQFAHYEAEVTQADDIKATRGHNVLIIDMPPGVDHDPADIRRIIRVANLVVIPTQQDPLDLRETVPFMRLVQEEGVPAAFLLNRARKKAKSLDRAREALNEIGPLIPVEVPHYEDISNAIGVGMSVIEMKSGFGVSNYRSVWTYVRRVLEI
jgi:chromosome partitioning protein